MDNFAVEFAQPFTISFDLLNRSHIDIYAKKTTIFGKCRLYFVSGPSVICFYLSLWTYASKIFYNQIEFYELAYIVPVLMVTTQGFLKGAIIITKKAKIRTVIRELGVMWRDGLSQTQYEERNSLLKRLHLCHAVFYWMNILGSWQYILFPSLETIFCRFMLEEDNELLLPFSCSFPFNPTLTWGRYIAVYIFQAYSMIHLIYIYLGAEFLMINLCALLSVEFTILRDELLHVTPASSKNDPGPDDVTFSLDVGTRATLNDVIKEHQILIKLSKQVNDIFNKMVFVNLLFATVTICFFGFVAKMARGPADMLNNFVGVVASILPIFNLCYYGEILMGAVIIICNIENVFSIASVSIVGSIVTYHQSAGMGESAYKNLWYKGNVKYRKNILFIIIRSQRACCMTSLNFSPVKLSTFSAVLSKTWSYFSLVNSLYEDKD